MPEVLPAEIYGEIISHLSSERSTLCPLLLTSKFLSAEANRILLACVTLRNIPAHKSFLLTLPTYPHAHLIRKLSLHDLTCEHFDVSFTSRLDLNAVFRATSGLEALTATILASSGRGLVETMKGVTFKLKTLHWPICTVDEATMALFSSPFGSDIADLRISQFTFPPHNLTLPRLQSLRVSQLTVECADLVQMRRVRRLCTYDISSATPLDLSSVEALSVSESMLELVICPKLRFLRLDNQLDPIYRITPFSLLEHVVLNSQVDSDELARNFFGLAPRLRVVDLFEIALPKCRRFVSVPPPEAGSNSDGDIKEVEGVEMDFDCWRTFPF